MLPEFVNPQLVEAMQQHAVEEYPKESCGLVVDGQYRPYKNVADDPMETFRISPQAWVGASKLGEIQAVVHSHCNRPRGAQEGPRHPPHPSASDMEGQIRSKLPWAIVHTDGGGARPPLWWGDFRLSEDLIGAEYIHGVSDCYAVVRRWFWQERGILLNDHPRAYNWWSMGQNLYIDHMRSDGWRQIEESEVRVGDCCLMRVRSPVINHMAVYVGDSLILQHFDQRLSRREPVYPWKKHIEIWLRHHTQEDERQMDGDSQHI